MVDHGAGRAVPARDAGLTVGLLLIGLAHVTVVVASLRDLPATLDAQTRAMHLGSYTAVGPATAIGWIASGSLLLSLVLAIGFAVPRLKAGRTAWWIPVVCAVIGWTVVIALTVTAIFADPSVMQHATG